MDALDTQRKLCFVQDDEVSNELIIDIIELNKEIESTIDV